MMTTEQLRMIQQAYLEGFADGMDHQNLSWKWPPANVAWLRSAARREFVAPYVVDDNDTFDAVNQWRDRGRTDPSDIPRETLRSVYDE